MAQGLIYIFTGEGKGKTSAALGVATRALLLGKTVSWVAFYKQASWGIAEAKLADTFPNMTMYFGGHGFMIHDSRFKRVNGKVAPVGGKGHVVVDTASEGEHQAAAVQCLVQAREQLASKPFLLVLDEALNAVSDGLVREQDVLDLLEERGETHVVLTGRSDPHLTRMILVKCDLVTECKKIKHPYDEGKLAVAGLDF